MNRFPKKVFVRYLLLASSLTFAIVNHAQTVTINQPPTSVTILDSTKAQDGLNGSVRRVKTESAKLEFKAGKLVEGPRQLVEITTYDLSGKRTENVSYPVSSSSAGKEEYKYDDKGNIVEMTMRGEDGAILSRETYTYEFDRLGNWTKMTTSLVVFESGELKREPVEVTYRSLTYYFDDSVAKMVDAPARPARAAAQPPRKQALRNKPTTDTQAPGQNANSSGNIPGAAADTPSNLSEPRQVATSTSEPPTESSANSRGARPVNSSETAKREIRKDRPRNEFATENTKPDARTEVPKSEPVRESSKSEPRSDIAKSEARTETPASESRVEARKPDNTNSEMAKSQPQPEPVRTEGSSEQKVNSANPTDRRSDTPASPSVPQSNPTSQPIANAGSNTAEVMTPERKNALALLQMGRERYDQGDSKGAVDAYRQSIALEPNSAETYLSLGQVYLKLKNDKEATKALKECVRLNPSLAEAHYGLGLAAFRMARNKDAADSFKRAIGISPQMAKAHYGLALAYQELHNERGVIDEYRILEGLDKNLAKQLARAFPDFDLPCRVPPFCK